MNRTTRVASLLLLGAGATLSACRRQQPEAPAPAPAAVNQDSIDAAARDRARQDSIDAAARAERERAEAERAERERRMTEMRNALTAAVFFDYDASEITDQARTTLDAKLPILNGTPSLRIRVAGNTDSRGSDEYNLALGQRRAASAKRYLVQRGVADDRIEVVSYGEERPAAQGEDETAYAQNRRAEFEITAGGDSMTVPQQ